MKNVLTIAGFDPSSGAGITKDLDIFFSLGLHGIAAPTGTVVQSPQGVRTIYPTPTEAFISMITSIRKDMEVHGVKIGVMVDERYVEILSDYLPEYPEIPVVVDPVLSAKNGVSLLNDKGLKKLVKSVFPKATVITPNLEEASRITGEKVKTLKDMEGCARALAAAGPQAVIIKGGHLKGQPTDLLFDGSDCITWQRKRVDRIIHGTGCVFSSLLVSFLVHGYSIRESFLASESCMDELIKEGYRISKDGYFYISSGIRNHKLSEKWKVLRTMQEAVKQLNLMNPVECIPEAQMNIGFAMSSAQGIEDVAAFPGRIGVHGGKVYSKGEPQFGASRHVARFILGFMEYFPSHRSCVNIRFDKMFIARGQEKGLSVFCLGGGTKASTTREKKENDIDSLIRKILKEVDNPPDMIYDEGFVGKEPMIRLFARSPLELLQKMEMIAR